MRLLDIIAAVGLVQAAHGQTVTESKQKAAPKSSVDKAAATKTSPVAKKSASKSTTKTGAKSKKQAVVARRPPLQQQPTAGRYKEIQQALADKGYFRGPVDGTWGLESVDALKRFQKEQNLDPDGKIGALSLMALGLGPRRGPAAAQAADPAVDPPPVAVPQP